MQMGRLSEEFRQRTKRFASWTIKLYVMLPKNKEEVRVVGKQMLRAGTSVAAQTREASRARSSNEFISKLGGAPFFGLSYCAKIVESPWSRRLRWSPKPTN
jgi:hypothetical protein